MKKIAKKTVVSTKNFVVAHKGAFMFAGTVAGLIAVNKMALKDHDNFLKEHGLYETYYNTPQG